ncbi:AraC family transcriptional regulator [Undibacterium sp. TJN25]|uniref:AraC family transcriptional regulator n=1 Tax=Undibacterium sp. TJN25 TaxID=3413056 RepID=UPI003BF1C552
MRDSTEMQTDPFSDILKFANAQSVVSGGFTTGGPWAIRFWPKGKIKFFAVVKGHCWLSTGGESAPVLVEAGDVFLLSAQGPFILAGDLETAPVESAAIFTPGACTITQLGDGSGSFLIGGHVRLDALSGELLADVLPPLIHVRASSARAKVLQWIVDQLVHEGASEFPGADAASAQLAQLMFVQLLRAYLTDADALPAGWLRTLGDARLAPALRLMHGDPAHQWQLEELANAAAMSRTTFALRFRTAAGVPPLTYLFHWRMRLAERALRDGNATMAALAASLGYTSESAFSNAFKRTTGMAPKRYRDAARAEGGRLQPELADEGL